MPFDITVFKVRKHGVAKAGARYIAVVEDDHHPGLKKHYRCGALMELAEQLTANHITLPLPWPDIEGRLEEVGVWEHSEQALVR